MTSYIYIPVATPEMCAFAEDWQQGQIAKGKQPYQILSNCESGILKGIKRKAKLGVLRDVSVSDKVYILAHGHGLGSSAIGARRGAKKELKLGIENWQGGDLKKYTPLDLAEVLKDEGLRTGFQDLRVFACGSANVPPKEGCTSSFAQGLAEALRECGYNSIKVTGYQGMVKTSYAHRTIAPMSSQFSADKHKGVVIGNQILPASTKRVVF
ncbi:hypothetical protein ACU5DF_07020 [Aliivibrio wodanis]|uniref:hypothetical protein n=1 Tax=Aliivibrio wodanis TaxID=80852 RepID=UPI00406D178D